MNLAEIFELSTTDYILLALLAVMVYRWFKRRNEPEIDMPKPVVVRCLFRMCLIENIHNLESIRCGAGMDRKNKVSHTHF